MYSREETVIIELLGDMDPEKEPVMRLLTVCLDILDLPVAEWDDPGAVFGEIENGEFIK